MHLYKIIIERKWVLKISIITVTFNNAAVLEDCIKSVLNQSHNSIEHIVIDGGSKDNTINILKKYQNHFSKFISESDQGIYHAMNKGIKMSSGRWIIFMNSGDLFYKKNVLYNFLSENIKNCDIVYGDTLVSAKNLRYTINSKSFKHKTLLMPFCHQSVFVKSNILKKRSFSLKYRFSSDFDFFYYCYLSRKKFQKIDYIISKVKSGGFADKNRQMVLTKTWLLLKKKEIKAYYICYT